MFSVFKPSDVQIEMFINHNRNMPFSYTGVGSTQAENLPIGYVVDRNRVLLGHGEAIFIRAKQAIEGWEMFDIPWLTLCWNDAPIKTGTTVSVMTRALVLWTQNACRIVYTINEARRFGFAYGTLPSHVERGEERFLVQWLANDEVWYDVLAFSRPNHLLTRIGYKYARYKQKAFGAATKKAMVAAVKS